MQREMDWSYRDLWKLEEAEEKAERSKKTQIEILYIKLGEECVAGCNRHWLEMAVAVLERNNIKQADFAEAVRNGLEKGRGKYRNVYLKGPANCAKTFLLNPLNTACLQHIFQSRHYNLRLGGCGGSRGPVS